jgi:hypothetical protein
MAKSLMDDPSEALRYITSVIEAANPADKPQLGFASDVRTRIRTVEALVSKPDGAPSKLQARVVCEITVEKGELRPH